MSNTKRMSKATLTNDGKRFNGEETLKNKFMKFGKSKKGKTKQDRKLLNKIGWSDGIN